MLVYGTFGLAICYDIRFPELAQLMTRRGLNMIYLFAKELSEIPKRRQVPGLSRGV